MSVAIPSGSELSQKGQSDLKHALRCMLLAALAATYPSQSMAQQDVIKTLDRVTTFGVGYVPVPSDITTLDTVYAYAMNLNTTAFYLDGVRMGDTFLGPVDTENYNEPEPVPAENPQPDTPCLDSQSTSLGAPPDPATYQFAAVKNNPVDVTNGLKHYRGTDFQSISNPDLKFTRYKNPLWKGVGILGQGWTTNLDLKISFVSDSGACYPAPGRASCYMDNAKSIYFYTEEGGIIQFRQGAGGLWNAENGSWIEKPTDANDPDRGKYVLRLRSGAFSPKMIFRRDGFVERVEQTDGNKLFYTYDSGNRLVRVTHTSGRSIGLSWTSATPGAVTSVTAPNGAVYKYEYYSGSTEYVAGINPPVLRKVIYPDGKGNVEFVHDQADDYVRTNKLLQIRINGAPFTNYTYWGFSNMVVGSSYADGTGLTKYEYFEDRTETLNPLGRKTIYKIAHGKIIEVEGVATMNCKPSFSFASYLGNGLIGEMKSELGVVTRYEYDGYGRKTRAIEAVGTPQQRVTVWEWDVARDFNFGTELLKRVAIEGEMETVYSYRLVDQSGLLDGLLSSVTTRNLNPNTSAAERTVTYSYTFHPNGMIATLTEDGPAAGSADRRVSSYNESGDLVSVENSHGHRKTFSGHNGFGQPSRVVEPTGAVTEYEYDARGRVVVERTFPSGSPVEKRYTYGASGLLDAITTSDGNTILYHYDAARRLIQEDVTEPGGGYAVKKYTYNAMSQPVRIEVGRE